MVSLACWGAMARRPGEYEIDDDDERDGGDGAAGVAPYPAMAEADLAAAVEIASSGGAGGEVVLTDRGLKGRQVLSLREPLANWAAASIVHLDLSRNRLRDKGAGAVVKVLWNSSIKRLQLEHNGWRPARHRSATCCASTRPSPT